MKWGGLVTRLGQVGNLPHFRGPAIAESQFMDTNERGAARENACKTGPKARDGAGALLALQETAGRAGKAPASCRERIRRRVE